MQRCSLELLILNQLIDLTDADTATGSDVISDGVCKARQGIFQDLEFGGVSQVMGDKTSPFLHSRPFSIPFSPFVPLPLPTIPSLFTLLPFLSPPILSLPLEVGPLKSN